MSVSDLPSGWYSPELLSDVDLGLLPPGALVRLSAEFDKLIASGTDIEDDLKV